MTTSPTVPSARRQKQPKTVFSKQQHPHYFGHFINQGRHNAFMIMADISETFGCILESEEQLFGAPLLRLLDEAKKPDETARLVQTLIQRFTFLRYMTIDQNGNPTREALPSEVKQVLSAAFEVLRRLRNEYSHYGSEAAGSWLVPKNGGYAFPLLEIYKAAIHCLRARYKHYTDEDIEALFPSQGNTGQVPNDTSVEPCNHQALVFFTCFFLERDEASRFFARLEDFNDTSTLSRRAKLDAYREFCCRLPQPKLESGDILLDMFNELGRCPGVLYSMLSDEERKKFDKTPEPDEYQEEGDVLPSVLVRGSDRFPWFALRYFDDMKVFPTLRFHLQLGRFITKKYEKTMNQVARDRIWLRPIQVFARWENVDATDLRRTLYDLKYEPNAEQQISKLLRASNIPKSWLAQNKGVFSLRPEIDQFSTRYLMGSNAISFRFMREGETEQGFLELPTQTNDKGEFKFRGVKQPDAVISTYELAALFLHQRLHGAQQTEHFIKDYIQRFRRFADDVKHGRLKPKFLKPTIKKPGDKEPKDKKGRINNERNAGLRELRASELEAQLRDGYGLTLKGIPSVFREYLMSYEEDSYRYLALQKLKMKRRETRYLLKDTGFVEDERTKKLSLPERFDTSKAPKSGQMGDWLAADIVFLKVPDGKGQGKPNDAQYNILQKMLAYFGGNKTDLTSYFEELGLTGKQAAFPHPFLEKIDVQKCRGVLEFYQKYLLERLNYLEQLVVAIDPYFGKKPPKKKDKQGLAEDEIKLKYDYFLKIRVRKPLDCNYSNQTALLPRGLFNEQNEQKLRAMGCALPEDKTTNMVFAFDRYADGATQPMYASTRYLLPPGETGKRGDFMPVDTYLKNQPKGKTPEDKAKIRRFESYALDDLQEIRYHQALDRALWFMALDRVKKNEDWAIDFSSLTLNDIEKVLTSEIRFNKKIGNVAIDTSLTVRRYGELRRILKDRRLKPLLSYFDEATSIKHEDIQLAFDEYERRRIPFFEAIFNFEKGVFEQCENLVLEHKGNRDYFNHWDYLTPAFQAFDSASKLEIERVSLGELRNKLLHNEIPLPEMFPSKLKSDTCPALVSEIFNRVEGYYRRILNS